MSDHRSVRWHRASDLEPARIYVSDCERYEIIWDPAGERVGEPGGWYLYEGAQLLGIFLTLKAAKKGVPGGDNDER